MLNRICCCCSNPSKRLDRQARQILDRELQLLARIQNSQELTRRFRLHLHNQQTNNASSQHQPPTPTSLILKTKRFYHSSIHNNNHNQDNTHSHSNKTKAGKNTAQFTVSPVPMKKKKQDNTSSLFAYLGQTNSPSSPTDTLDTVTTTTLTPQSMLSNSPNHDDDDDSISSLQALHDNSTNNNNNNNNYNNNNTSSSNNNNNNDQDDEVVCTICLGAIHDGDRVGALPCDHIFHVDCLKEWLKRKNVCPLCQQHGIATAQFSNTPNHHHATLFNTTNSNTNTLHDGAAIRHDRFHRGIRRGGIRRARPYTHALNTPTNRTARGQSS